MKLTGEEVQRLKEGIDALKPNRRVSLREKTRRDLRTLDEGERSGADQCAVA